MTSAQRRYVMIETLISVAINTAISIGFAWWAFGGSPSVAVRALILDAAPQSFMITLMSIIVPGLLTRRRLATGQIAPIARRAVRWPLTVRAVLAAMAAAVLGPALHASLTLWPLRAVSFPSTLLIKAVYGAALAGIVTPLMLRWALRAPATA